MAVLEPDLNPNIVYESARVGPAPKGAKRKKSTDSRPPLLELSDEALNNEEFIRPQGILGGHDVHDLSAPQDFSAPQAPRDEDDLPGGIGGLIGAKGVQIEPADSVPEGVGLAVAGPVTAWGDLVSKALEEDAALRQVAAVLPTTSHREKWKNTKVHIRHMLKSTLMTSTSRVSWSSQTAHSS